VPRIENVGSNVDEYCEKSGEGSSTFDICSECNETLLGYNTLVFRGDKDFAPYNGDPVGFDGHETWIDHPPYEECGYTCTHCHTPLTAKDD